MELDKRELNELNNRHIEHFLLSEFEGTTNKGNFKCILPGHKHDRNPSMSFNDEASKKYVKCFTCHSDKEYLDLFGLVRLKYGYDNFIDQVKFICEKYGEKINGLNLNGKKKDENKASYLQAPKPQDKAPEPINKLSYVLDYAKWQKETAKNRYWQDVRGLSQSTIDYFNLGINLFQENGKGTIKTAIIPVNDNYFIARLIDPEQIKIFGKYRNCKGKMQPFNIEDLTRIEHEPCFVLEGAIDCLTIFDACSNFYFCSLSGKSLTAIEERVKHIKKPLVFVLDNDPDRKDEKGNIIQTADDILHERKKTIIEKMTELNLSFVFADETFELLKRYKCKDLNEFYNLQDISIKEKKELLINALDYDKKQALNQKNEQLNNYINTYSLKHKEHSFLQETKNPKPLLKTGLNNLDSSLNGGLAPGLIVLGGLSGFGKTAFALQTACNIAEQNKDVLYFSLEVTDNEILSRIISRMSRDTKFRRNNNEKKGISTHEILYKMNAFVVQDEELLTKHLDDFFSLTAKHFYIVEGIFNLNVLNIEKRIKDHIIATGNTPFVIVDYLQGLAPYNEKLSDKQNADFNVRKLKMLSIELSTPILTLSSFNRSSYKSDEPLLSAFKESGGIEYTADLVLSLFAEKDSIKDIMESETRSIQLHILKNRNGATGKKIDIEYNARLNYFQDNEI